MNSYHIPQQLDAPFRIILWTIDEFLILAVPFFIFICFFNSLFTGLMIGIVLLMGLKKIKGDQGHYFLYHWLYWTLPPLFHYRATPPSYRRFFLG